MTHEIIFAIYSFFLISICLGAMEIVDLKKRIELEKYHQEELTDLLLEGENL